MDDFEPLEVGGIVVVTSKNSKYLGEYGFIYKCFDSALLGVMFSNGKKVKYTIVGIIAVEHPMEPKDEQKYQDALAKRNQYFAKGLSPHKQREVREANGEQYVPDKASSRSSKHDGGHGGGGGPEGASTLLALQQAVMKLAESVHATQKDTKQEIEKLTAAVTVLHTRLSKIEKTESKPESKPDDNSLSSNMTM